MKKALKESKWWFFIPLISLIFLHKMSIWVFSAENTNDCGYRGIIATYSIFLHLIPILFLITIFIK